MAVKWKLYAHAGCAILFFSFIIHMITRESVFFINLRQAYFLSPFYTSRISSRTVLFTSVPDDYMSEPRLRKMFGDSVRRVWMAADVEKLEEKVEERDDAAMKLEGAEVELIKAVNGARLKAEKKGEGRGESEERAESEEHALEGGSSVASRYIPATKRPTHRLKFLIGKKVDTIEWCRLKLQILVPEVDKMQREHKMGHFNKLNSVFVEFDSCSDAQTAYQALTHHQILQMAPRFIGMIPDEVIWSNLRIKWWERLVRRAAMMAAVVATIVFWSIPVAFCGSISNLDYLTEKIPWLSWIKDLPESVLGAITGLLPVVLLAVLMSLLPVYLRFLATLSGDPTKSAVELSVQNSYFGFQVVQVFLVATLASSAAKVAEQVINDPMSIATILAQNLPLASNFYLSYFMLQGLAVVGQVLLSLGGLVLFMVLGKLLDKTPRKMYRRWTELTSLSWGTLLPVYTTLWIIAICYAVIAPLVLGFAAIGLSFFYFAYRYDLLFVSNADVDTKGHIYPRALQQLFVGLYIAEACLVGLFAIATGESVAALGPLILMLIMLVATVLYNIALNSALAPLLAYLPKSLDAEERSLRAAAASTTTSTAKEATSTTKEAAISTTEEAASPPPRPRPSLLATWLRPDLHADYAALRALLVPHDAAAPTAYAPADAADAYLHPAVRARVPLLWVPRDAAGVSAEEVRATRAVIGITDEGAHLDDANAIVWDQDSAGRAPIHEDRVHY